MLETPVSIRTKKSSNIGPGQYLDERPLGTPGAGAGMVSDIVVA